MHFNDFFITSNPNIYYFITEIILNFYFNVKKINSLKGYHYFSDGWMMDDCDMD